MRFATKIYHPLVDKDDGKFCNEAIAENWKAVNNLTTVVTTVYEMLEVCGFVVFLVFRIMLTVIWLWILILVMRFVTIVMLLKLLLRNGLRSMLAFVFIKQIHKNYFPLSCCSNF